MDEGVMGSMMGILPMVVVGGAALMFTERFIERPQGKGRRKPFDRQEERDQKSRGRGLGFGDFRNIGW